MKRILQITIALALVGGTARAETIAYGGLRFQDAIKISAGVGTHVTGKLWTLNYVDLGQYSAFSSELAVITGLDKYGYGKSWVGLIAGPNADFGAESPDGGRSPLNYLTGAAGAVGGIWFSPEVGVWAYIKHKFEFENAVTYQNGFQGGVGLSLVL